MRIRPRPLALALLLSPSALLLGCPGECEPGFLRDDTGACLAAPPEACDEGSLAILGEESCVPIGWTECGDAFSLVDGSCMDLCPEGEDDSAACRAAGVLPCADGFARADYGCEAVLPIEPCAGGTRRALGSETCVPLGDCDAPFPPADATLFVDDDFEGEALDAAHFATLGEALAAARSGDVIAVDAGRYREPIVLPAGVSVVGRCAAEVIFEGPGAPGVKVRSVSGVRLSGVTVRGFDIGMEVERGAVAVVEDVLFEQNETVGVFVLDQGTRLTLRRSEVRDTKPVGGAFGTGIGIGFGGTLHLEESTITGSQDMGILMDGVGSAAHLEQSAIVHTRGRPDGTLGVGMYVPEGTRALVHESLLRDNLNVALNAVGEGAVLEVRRSVIEHTRSGTLVPEEELGLGINAQDGVSLVVEDVTLRDQGVYALRVGREGADAVVSGLVLDGVRPDAETGVSAGVVVETGASLVLSRSFLRAPDQGEATYPVGLFARRGASARLSDVTVAEAGAVGVMGDGADTLLELERVLIRDTWSSDPTFGFGLSLSGGAEASGQDLAVLRAHSSALLVERSRADFERVEMKDTLVSLDGRGRGASVQFDARLTLRRALVEGSAEVGLMAFGQGTLVEVRESAITDTALSPEGGHGHGVEALDGASIRTTRSLLARNAGVAAIYANAGGLLEDTLVTDNRVGLHAFEGSSVQELAEVPSAPSRLDVVVVRAAFIGNDTRLGAGVVPLPDPEDRKISLPTP